MADNASPLGLIRVAKARLRSGSKTRSLATIIGVRAALCVGYIDAACDQ
jgi:hypothetical protein